MTKDRRSEGAKSYVVTPQDAGKYLQFCANVVYEGNEFPISNGFGGSYGNCSTPVLVT